MLLRCHPLIDIPGQTDPKYNDLFMGWANTLALTEESHIQFQEAAVKHLEEGYALRRDKLEGAYFTSVQAWHDSDEATAFLKQLEVAENQRNLWKHDVMAHKDFQHLYSRLVSSYKSTSVVPDLDSPSPVYSKGGLAIFEKFKLNQITLQGKAVQDESFHRAWLLENHNFVFDWSDIGEKGNLPAMLKGYSTTQLIIGAAEAAEAAEGVDEADFASLLASVDLGAGAGEAAPGASDPLACYVDAHIASAPAAPAPGADTDIT